MAPVTVCACDRPLVPNTRATARAVSSSFIGFPSSEVWIIVTQKNGRRQCKHARVLVRAVRPDENFVLVVAKGWAGLNRGAGLPAGNDGFRAGVSSSPRWPQRHAGL